MNEQKPSIEQLRDGLQRLINSHFNMKPGAITRVPARQSDDDLMLSAALDRLEALEAEKTRAMTFQRMSQVLKQKGFLTFTTWAAYNTMRDHYLIYDQQPPAHLQTDFYDLSDLDRESLESFTNEIFLQAWAMVLAFDTRGRCEPRRPVAQQD